MARRLHYIVLGFFAAALYVAAPSLAQVSIAPTALFLNEQEQFGALYVGNPTANPQEVTIGFRFGYTTADSTGGIYVEFEDSTAAGRYSLAPFVRSFPQRFILPPGETQVVRLTARPPSGTDGHWLWTRVLTTSTPQVEFQDTTTVGIRTNLIFRLQQVTALFYTDPSATASLAVSGMTARIDSNEVVVLADLQKDGERPFFGRAYLRITDAQDQQIGEEVNLIAVYVSEQRRIAAELPPDVSSTAGLRAELTIVPDRNDVPERYILDLSPIVSSASVQQP